MGISEAIEHMRAVANLPPSSVSETDRKEALKACETLRASLESPIEVGTRILFSVSLLAALS